MTWVLITLAILAGLIALVVIIGVMLPKGHTASRSLMCEHCGPEQIWDIITDYANQSSWRTGWKKFERITDPSGGGKEIWREFDKRGQPLTLETTLAKKPLRLVRTIADPKLPFSGRWEYDLHPMTGGTKITITEIGEVSNPIFRFVAHFFMNKAGSIEAYLEHLAAKLNLRNPRITEG